MHQPPALHLPRHAHQGQEAHRAGQSRQRQDGESSRNPNPPQTCSVRHPRKLICTTKVVGPDVTVLPFPVALLPCSCPLSPTPHHPGISVTLLDLWVTRGHYCPESLMDYHQVCLLWDRKDVWGPFLTISSIQAGFPLSLNLGRKK